MKKNIYLLIGTMLLSGCASSGRMERLLTLKALANEQKNLNAYIEEQDKKFESLLEAARKGAIDQYVDRESIKKNFGDPVYVKQVEHNGESQEEWLYRYVTKFFDSEKVYLYFNGEGKLVKWKKQP